MEKHYFNIIVFSLLFSSTTLYAKKVDVETASQVALNAFYERSGISATKLQIKDILLVEHQKEPVYRIFNLIPKGYIIISAEDNTEPVLGYGLDANFSFEKAPPGLLYLLDEYKKEINFIKNKKLKGDKRIKEKWDKYSSENFVILKSYTPGSYLLKTLWYQYNGFNNECPLDPNTGDTCLVGCAPAALGQILHYWGCLVTPQGSNTYTPDGFTSSLSVNFGQQSYDWDAMSHSSPDEDNAELLYHCGVATEANYTDSSTTASSNNINYALQNYFGFETNGYMFKSGYSASVWASMLQSEISAYRQYIIMAIMA